MIAARNPRAIYFDPRGDEPASESLQAELRALNGKAAVVVRGGYSPYIGVGATVQIPQWLKNSQIRTVASAWRSNLWLYAQSSPYAFRADGRVLPALSADMAGVSGSPDSQFVPDFRINLRKVHIVTPGDLLGPSARKPDFSGKTVIVSRVRNAPDQLFGYFGKRGRYDPVYVDIAAATDIQRSISPTISGFPLLLLFLGLIVAVRRIASGRWRFLAYLGVSVFLVAAPAVAQTFGAFTRTRDAFVAAFVYTAMRLWAKWRRKVRETSQSGLPNFVALVQEKALVEHDIVVGVIARYEEFLASIPGELHGECARQIARRFAVGCGARTIYHGEAGFFAWSEAARPTDQQLEHLEGMRALFAAPLLVGGHMFDTNVHFGLDRNYKLDGQSRVNTALASASEALRDGRPVELFQADRLANAAWELSLLARIDEGMRNGDIWLAYQPQWDYRENRISGAEALIRWNDPVRGPIRPDEFILQAERAGRIDALTYWVLEQAIGAAEEFNAIGRRFQTSINLSAQLVDKPGLVSSMAEIVRRRGIDCRLLTVEVTETASLHDRPAAIRNLRELQAMGFRLSIDDFGTGEASLLYLAELPSDELKIDRQFVSRIVHHERERHIVRSTVKLAHALGQTVVAEGIEDLPTFDLLRKLGCDAGQGYYIGRPETFAQLRSRYTAKGGGLRGTA
ncbi:EAL domain-containing protein [Novosphingobium bradum]|uniref:EAL domain-containing protein n=1 Tax=Novosphingobium bradum TaxID=1737444 RepID=A0ABV7IPR8_9SPHN